MGRNNLRLTPKKVEAYSRVILSLLVLDKVVFSQTELDLSLEALPRLTAPDQRTGSICGWKNLCTAHLVCQLFFPGAFFKISPASLFSYLDCYNILSMGLPAKIIQKAIAGPKYIISSNCIYVAVHSCKTALVGLWSSSCSGQESKAKLP